MNGYLIFYIMLTLINLYSVSVAGKALAYWHLFSRKERVGIIAYTLLALAAFCYCSYHLIGGA